jgi:hypothetical protein
MVHGTICSAVLRVTCQIRKADVGQYEITDFGRSVMASENTSLWLADDHRKLVTISQRNKKRSQVRINLLVRLGGV